MSFLSNSFIRKKGRYLTSGRGHQSDKDYIYKYFKFYQNKFGSEERNYRLLKMNNDAFLYSNHDELQRIDADHILTTFSNLLKWKNSENVLDVGSADGGITTEILMPNLPKDFKKLVGVDIAEKMVAFANNNSKNNPKVEFHVLDITCSKVPSEFRHHFDHVFSFYCLNWIPEERYVPTNILNIIYIELQ